MPVRDKIFFSAILFFFAVLFIPSLEILHFLSVATLVIVSLWYKPLKEKPGLLKERPHVLWMIAFFLLILASVAFSSHSKPAFRYLDSRLPLFYFPLSIGLVSVQKELRDKILLGIAVIITVAMMACVGYGIYRSASLHSTAYLYNDALSEPVTGQQSIYSSLLVNIAIYIFTWFLFFKPGTRNKPLIVLAILFLFVASFLLASRNLMLVLYASTIVFGAYYIIRQKKYLEGLTLIMGLLIGIFLVFKFSTKTINRFKELTFTQFSYGQTGPESHYNMDVSADQWNGANTRLAIWQCGWQLFKQQPLLGVTIGDKKAELMDVYRSKGFTFAIRTEKNLHNNYLDILVSLGIVGLLLFLVGWLILPIRLAWRNKDMLAVLVMVTFALAMVTENYFDRTLGSMLFGFFIPFMLSDKTAKN